jgi:hypothetical protein
MSPTGTFIVMTDPPKTRKDVAQTWPSPIAAMPVHVASRSVYGKFKHYLASFPLV